MGDFSTQMLGFPSYAAVTAANSGNGYANMTTEQVRHLLSWVTFTTQSWLMNLKHLQLTFI